MQYVKGPLLILAGAGGGKTSLLTCKIAWLLREYDVDPAALLVLTVNAGSARRIRTGVQDILGRKVPDLAVLTFSELAMQLIQERPAALGLRAGFSLYDATESEAVVARLLGEHLPQALALAGDVRRALALIERQPEAPAADRPTERSPADIARWLRPLYEQRLEAANAVDVARLAPQAARLLENDAELAHAWRSRLRFLLVDEYEQTGGGEHALTRLLAAGGVGLTVAGDDAEVARDDPDPIANNLARLRDDFPGLRVVRLEQNFRARTPLLRAAQAALAPRAHTSGAVPTRTAGAPPVRVLQLGGEQHEAESIVRALLEHRSSHGTDYHEYAVLFHRPEQAARLEWALQTRRVPYHLRGGRSLFEQPEVRDFWAYLKLLSNPCDDNAFLRAVSTPRRDIEHATIERLIRFAAERGACLLAAALDPQLQSVLAQEQYAALHNVAALLHDMSERAQHTEPVALAHELLARLRYDEWLRDTCNDFNIAARRMDKVMHLVATLHRAAQARPGAGLHALVAQLSLNAVLDPPPLDAVDDDGVALVALTHARGTEFAHVFIAGLEETPVSSPDCARAATAAELRRLAYIGITRARESVTFTLAEPRAPNTTPTLSFLADLGTAGVEWVSASPGSGYAESALARTATRPPGAQHYRR